MYLEKQTDKPISFSDLNYFIHCHEIYLRWQTCFSLKRNFSRGIPIGRFCIKFKDHYPFYGTLNSPNLIDNDSGISKFSPGRLNLRRVPNGYETIKIIKRTATCQFIYETFKLILFNLNRSTKNIIVQRSINMCIRMLLIWKTYGAPLVVFVLLLWKHNFNYEGEFYVFFVPWRSYKA